MPSFYGTVKGTVSHEFELEADTEDDAIKQAEAEFRASQDPVDELEDVEVADITEDTDDDVEIPGIPESLDA